MAKGEKIRVQVDLTEAEFEALESAIKQGVFASKADAIRRVIRLLVAMEGKEMLLRNADGTTERILWI